MRSMYNEFYDEEEIIEDKLEYIKKVFKTVYLNL